MAKTLTHAEVTTLLGKAVKHPDFAHRLVTEPDKVLIEEGYERTEDGERFFRQIHEHGFLKTVGAVHARKDDDPFQCGTFGKP